LSQSTRVTDRRTDRQTEISSLYRVCITCSAVKIMLHHANKLELPSVILLGKGVV